ncbi:MAG: quinone-dependent dihydroorotate dehydrogenase [Pseudomonadota bacterium]
MNYPAIKSLLFRVDAERTHEWLLSALRMLQRVPGGVRLLRAIYAHKTPVIAADLLGLHLSNPVGLAAGLDKNGHCTEAFAALGFGWLEVGTVTPRAQPGNPKPRLFRLPARQAIINRMGFNNAGAEVLAHNLKHARRACPLGVNIGKNKITTDERAADDYVRALRMVYAVADYVTVNISSPNTPGLRALQESAALEKLLATLKLECAELARMHGGRTLPLALKIAPDLDDEQIDHIATQVIKYQWDAIVATNTTLSRVGVEDIALSQQAGGLSGVPLKSRATEVIARLYRTTQGRVPIIGVGGIANADDAWEKICAGADAVQVYTALIYHGPKLVRDIVAGLREKMRAMGAPDWASAVTQARLSRPGDRA